MIVELPSLDALRTYLAVTGWTQFGTYHNTQVWTFPADADGPEGEVLVPQSADLRDCARRIREAVQVIASVELCSESEIVQNIIDSKA